MYRVDSKNNKYIDGVETSADEYYKYLIDNPPKELINLKYLSSVYPIFSKEALSKDDMQPFLSKNNISISYDNYNSDELKTISYLAPFYKELIASNPRFIGEYATLLIGDKVKVDIIYHKKDDFNNQTKKITFDEFILLKEIVTNQSIMRFTLSIKDITNNLRDKISSNIQIQIIGKEIITYKLERNTVISLQGANSIIAKLERNIVISLQEINSIIAKLERNESIGIHKTYKSYSNGFDDNYFDRKGLK